MFRCSNPPELLPGFARRAERRGDRRIAARFETRAGTADEHAGKLETMLLARMEKPAPN